MSLARIFCRCTLPIAKDLVSPRLSNRHQMKGPSAVVDLMLARGCLDIRVSMADNTPPRRSRIQELKLDAKVNKKELNWAELGLNTIYISLELSEDLTSMRMDAMTSGFSTKQIMKNIDDVGLKVRAFGKKTGKGTLQIKQLPNGSTANDIRAYVKEYEIQKRVKVDAVLVDYLDLCSPLDKRVSPSDLFVKDKYVSEELRNLAIDLDILMVTASQLNRGSHDEIEFSHSHIAGGISKINTADNVIAIFTTISMKESGRYQIQFMKTRSSAGVGSKVDLKFDIASLRIVDLEEGEEDATMATAATILGTLKKSNIVTDVQETEGEKASRSGANTKQSAKALRDLVRRK